MNVLDKTDKSTRTFKMESGTEFEVSKQKMYLWEPNVGEKPEFLWIDRDKLNLDGRYQRDAKSESIVRKIASKFNWVMCGALLVAKRNDGTYWVLDGGHRTRSAFYRTDIKALPCLVFPFESLTDEAKAFYGVNTMKSTVSSYQQHKALTVANEPLAVKINQMLESCDLVLSTQGKKNSEFVAVVALQKAIIRDEEIAQKVLRWCKTVAGQDSIHGNLFKGMFALCVKFKDHCDIIKEYGNKLAGYKQDGLIAEIRSYSSITAQGGEVVFANALLRLINKGKQKKLLW